MFTPEWLELLVCPKCKGQLQCSAEQWLLCSNCEVRYPVEDGIPVLLSDAAEPAGEAGTASTPS